VILEVDDESAIPARPRRDGNTARHAAESSGLCRQRANGARVKAQTVLARDDRESRRSPRASLDGIGIR
jgi:hypothetical protein